MNRSEIYDKWNTAVELMGEKNFLSELFNALSVDEIKENLEWIDRHHELGLFNEEDGEEN